MSSSSKLRMKNAGSSKSIQVDGSPNVLLFINHLLIVTHNIVVLSAGGLWYLRLYTSG